MAEKMAAGRLLGVGAPLPEEEKDERGLQFGFAPELLTTGAHRSIS